MFENTRKAIHKVHLLLLTLSQSILVCLPLFKLLNAPPLGIVIKSLIISSCSLIMMIFNLIVESRDEKPTKSEKNFAKKFRKHAKTVANFTCFILLLFAWYTNDDKQLVFPLIITTISVVSTLITYIFRYIAITLAEGFKEDVTQSFTKVGQSLGQAGRRFGESVSRITQGLKKKPTEPQLEAPEELPAIPAATPQEQPSSSEEDLTPAPKKKFSVTGLFTKKRTSRTLTEELPEQEETEEVREEALPRV